MEHSQPPDDIASFRQAFAALQGGYAPFPWQERLFRSFVVGKIPSALDLPTGLGKTSVMTIWLIARALADDIARKKLPRRLVYVVDRRAVVDQASAEAAKIRDGLARSGLDLEKLGISGDELPISTLRGKHIDNRKWLSDPTASAIIVGTVDMIGSRLLFSGYGVSQKMRPYHAGLLGTDTLIVLDEAHLVPPFEALTRMIEGGQSNAFGPRSADDRKIVPCFRLMSLSATGREKKKGEGEANAESRGQTAFGQTVFRLDADDEQHSIVACRLKAPKRLTIHDTFDGKASLVDELAKRAWLLGTSPKPARVLVYCHGRADAEKIKEAIDGRAKKEKVKASSELLVGQRRVHERENLFVWLKDRGFIDGPVETSTPAFLIATAAGEVGIDMDADHIVCDLVEWERMVQRLGRVNRRGGKQSQVEVVVLPSKENKKADDWAEKVKRLRAPLDLLPALAGGGRDASPGAVMAIKANPAAAAKMEAAQTPEPLRPALTRALVDAWSMTSLEEHAGRPDDIGPWLRGWEDATQEPQTAIVWREHLPVRIQGGRSILVTKSEINRFFDAAPPHLSEVLETETRRASEWLFARVRALAAEIGKRERAGDASATIEHSVVLFLLNAKNEIEDGGSCTLGWLTALDDKSKDRERKAFITRLTGKTLVVAAALGGLKHGVLDDDGDAEGLLAMDTDEKWNQRPFRVRAESQSRAEGGWIESYRFASAVNEDGDAPDWLIIEERKGEAESEEARAISRNMQKLVDHQQAMKTKALWLADAVDLPKDYAEMLAMAALFHDEGKDCWRWQRAFKAPADAAYAKTRGPVNFKLLDGYRHEFGSLLALTKNPELQQVSPDLRDLLLHLVAAHHGNARPLISIRNAEGSAVEREACALEAMLRFERLQKRWGPWGLAWLESLLRAADQQASRANDEPGRATGGNATAGEAA
jgi:CRISPR-associated endonuclease/helicase Cas3